MSTLVEKIHELNERLTSANIPHAFGGAIALAYCVGDPRATADIDINIFLVPERVAEVLEALPPDVVCTVNDRSLLVRDGQARLWWDQTPVDIFLSAGDFQDEVAQRVRFEELNGREIPLLACSDLAVFKAFFNRRKDWADLEAMVMAGSFDVDQVLGTLARFLGPDDPRVQELRDLDSSP